MTLTLRYAARSDRGLIREINQDSFYAGPRLLAVADGMGGMAAGDVASNIVIAGMAPLDEDVPGDHIIDVMRAAVENANQQLRDAVDANPALEGMGTTLTALLFTGSKFCMVHVGDSRAYLLRDGEFVQITKDDTYVQMLVDEGRLTNEEANSHPQKSLLTRALDGRDVDPEYSVRQAVAGDRYLICSDGLSGVVSAETIAEGMREYADPNQCVDRMVQLALRGGGPDNITVVVIDVIDDDISEDEPLVGGAAARDRGNTTVADSSMSAARAATLAPPRQAVPVGDARSVANGNGRPRRGGAWKTVLTLVILLGLLGGGLYYGWHLTQQRYYVSATDDGHLAIYQGVPGRVAGLDLNNVREVSEYTLADLTEVARQRVEAGIQAGSEADAQRKLAELTSPGPANTNLLPECPTPTPSPAPSLTASASPTAAGSPRGTGSASPTASASPTDSATPAVTPPACRNG
jgi:protein phosphatase